MLLVKEGVNDAIHSSSALGPIALQISRRNGRARGRAMIDVSAAILGLVSFAVFAAHAVDTYRAGGFSVGRE
jgi:hypothetical protein